MIVQSNNLGLSQSRRQYVMGNWKLNGHGPQQALLMNNLEHYAQALQLNQSSDVTVAVFPANVYVQSIGQRLAQGLTTIAVGAQNVSAYEQGAYTGEQSAQMLKDVGCEYVLVGHSERRTLFGEEDEVLAEKVAMSLHEGLVPVLCVGETLEEHTGGVSGDVVRQQVINIALKVGIKAFSSIVIAYEPVWAIGTGKVATPEYAQQMHAYIRQVLSDFDQTIAEGISILYGGSVNAENAASLFEQPDIDGALVGGASLDAEAFLAIAKAKQQAMQIQTSAVS